MPDAGTALRPGYAILGTGTDPVTLRDRVCGPGLTVSAACDAALELWQSHHRLVYLGVLAGPHRAAPTEDDTLGAESGQPEGVARPVLDVAELRGDLENGRQPPSGDGERPQIRSITMGRVVG